MRRWVDWRRVLPFLLLMPAAAAWGQGEAKRLEPVDGSGLLAGIKAPPGFKVTLFAAPPEIRYPTCLSAAPTGELFVGIDENGSLDAKADRGRVVRCIDADGDGRADRFNDFARMDSPRGLIVDAGTLYVLHPPFLSAYHDDNGDGQADRSEDLVNGIGFDLKFRGADHTTNGIRLGIDGWIYVAVGDYGFIKAVGKDGTSLQFHGGGVVRVRPDGSGLERVSRGQRNIYDVAIDPYMNLFTRDNTNDGGGWDVRLSHVIPTGDYGYPSRFTRFADEVVAPLADYGGGSPTGSVFVQEPGLPPDYDDALYTCEWGRNAVYRHPLEAKGAGFRAGQEPFVELPRPTDMDIDGQSRIYISSWREGGFTFDKPDVGYVIRVTGPGPKTPAFPNLKAARADVLLAHLASNSEVLRLHAQREILRRNDRAAFARGLESLARSHQRLPGRVAAIFTLEQLLGPDAHAPLVRLADLPAIREFALRALADRKGDTPAVPRSPFVKGLADTDPRVRLQAVVALGRLGAEDAAEALLARTDDADPLVAHAAVNALVSLRAVDAALKGLDPVTPRLISGSVRVLQGLHEPGTIDGLIRRLDRSRDETVRHAALKALCRLYHREADWDGRWWGTRPDTSGPYFKAADWSETTRIGQTLSLELKRADQTTARWLLAELLRNKVDLDGSLAMALKLAVTDASLRTATVESLAGRSPLSAEAVRFLGTVASSQDEATTLRARALRGLERNLDQPEAFEAAVRGFASIDPQDETVSPLIGAWREFVNNARHARNAAAFVALTSDPDSARSTLAYAVLLEMERRPRSRESVKAEARKAIEHAWTDPRTAVNLLRAIGQTRSQSQARQVRAHRNDENPAIRKAAELALQRLDLDGTSRGSGGQGPTVAKLPYEQVLAAVLKAKGDPALGSALFQRQGCIACHTVSATDPPKGPFLGGIGTRYSRTELSESVLKPSAKIAQGFETQTFATVAGLVLEGFVSRESGDEVEIRNTSGEVAVLPKKEIEERGKLAVSVMPAGLADSLTVPEFASLLAYLESLKAK